MMSGIFVSVCTDDCFHLYCTLILYSTDRIATLRKQTGKVSHKQFGVVRN